MFIFFLLLGILSEHKIFQKHYKKVFEQQCMVYSFM